MNLDGIEGEDVHLGCCECEGRNIDLGWCEGKSVDLGQC